MSSLPLRGAAALVSLLFVNACGLLTPSSPATSSTTTAEPGKSTPEARAALIQTYDRNLVQCQAKVDDMNKKLGDALTAIAGGAAAPSLGQAVAKLQSQKVTVTIDVLGSNDMPTLMVKDSLMTEGQTLQGAPPGKLQSFAKRMTAAQPYTTALRGQVQAVNATLGSSFGAAVSCNLYAQAFTTQLGAMANGGEEPSPEPFTEYAKFLQANARAKSVAGASVALMAVVQAGFAGKDPKGIDQLVDGVRQMKDNPETVTDDQAKQAYQAAGQGLVDGCREQMEKAYRDHPQLQRPAVDPCSKEGSRVRGSPSEEKARAGNDSSAQSGGLVDDVVRRLVPRNTPLADASDAVLAIKNGDYLSALKGAAKLVGRVSPLGGVISNVLGLFG